MLVNGMLIIRREQTANASRSTASTPPVTPASDPAGDSTPVALAAGYGSFPQLFRFVPQLGIAGIVSVNALSPSVSIGLCTTNGATRMESLTNGA
jgi:hypothetical protein